MVRLSIELFLSRGQFLLRIHWTLLEFFVHRQRHILWWLWLHQWPFLDPLWPHRISNHLRGRKQNIPLLTLKPEKCSTLWPAFFAASAATLAPVFTPSATVSLTWVAPSTTESFTVLDFAELVEREHTTTRTRKICLSIVLFNLETEERV